MNKINSFLDRIRDLLQGEPVLVIGNGAAVVIYLVAKAVLSIEDVSFADALVRATAGIATLNVVLATIRNYVYSPLTVQVIAEQSAETGIAQVPPPPAADLGKGNG